jgi:hypothetical protein
MVQSLAIIVTGEPGLPRIERPPAGALPGLCYGIAHGHAAAMDFAQEAHDLQALGNLLFGLIVLGAMTVCTVTDGVSGLFTAMSTEEVALHVQCIQRAFAGAPEHFGLDAALRDAVARVRPGMRLVSAAEPADVELRVSVRSWGLLGQCGVDPDVAVVIEVATEWVSGAGVHQASFQYRSPIDPLTVWTRDERRIPAELSRAGIDLAQRIVDDLLLVEVVRR